jgi:hypothetical protein
MISKETADKIIYHLDQASWKEYGGVVLMEDAKRILNSLVSENKARVNVPEWDKLVAPLNNAQQKEE